MVSQEAIQDIMEVLEVILTVAQELRPEDQVPTVVLEEVHVVINPQRALRREVVLTADRDQVLPEVVDIVDLGPALPEAAVTVPPPEAQEAMVEVPGDQEVSVEVLEVGVPQEGVLQAEEAAEEGTNSINQVN